MKFGGVGDKKIRSVRSYIHLVSAEECCLGLHWVSMCGAATLHLFVRNGVAFLCSPVRPELNVILINFKRQMGLMRVRDWHGGTLRPNPLSAVQRMQDLG